VQLNAPKFEILKVFGCLIAINNSLERKANINSITKHGSSMFILLRDLQMAFHNCCTNLHSHQQCSSIPFSPHPHQHLLLFLLLITAIFTGVRWNVNVFWFAFPLLPRIYHFFIYLLAICTSSENYLFSLFAYLFHSLHCWLFEG
jgi:hypothetical protein